jgi:hypothetical protein
VRCSSASPSASPWSWACLHHRYVLS